MTTSERTEPSERTDLLDSLRTHREFIRATVRGLTDSQAAQRTTVSELCLGGLVKHVAGTESEWMDFVERGTEAMAGTPEDWSAYADGFRMLEGETLEGLLDRYDEVARRTDALVVSLPDLGLAHALPAAPWFAPGSRRSARRVFLHVIAETAQHAGHADIIRESLDGQKTMG